METLLLNNSVDLGKILYSLVESAFIALKSLLCLHLLMGSWSDDINTSTTDHRFPLVELSKVKVPIMENKVASKTEDTENEDDSDGDEEHDEDGESGDEGSDDEDGESGDEGSDDDEDSDDDEANSESDDDDDDEEDEDEDEDDEDEEE
ncbi:hypothetical protein ACOSQ3_021350 [Xanthoceras sorbifolium]